MSLNVSVPEIRELRPRIVVFGVGGAGGNAVDNMIDKALEGAEFVAANTDSQALQRSRADHRIQLGAETTQGLGAGANPDIGRDAAGESVSDVDAVLRGCHMCFITAGMGGGTGTGAAPVIAQRAREMGVLTVGVVTKPFVFEGSPRMRIAEVGIAELQKHVDTLIIIPNQNLFRIANERTTFAEAFIMADDVLYQGVKGVTDLMVRPGIVNLDFADVRAVMNEMGKAMMGSGEAEGEGRALEAAEKAIANPLLDEVSLQGARGVLINITGGSDMTLFEVDEAANRIAREVDPEARVFFGSALDPEMTGKLRVSVVATGIEEGVAAAAVAERGLRRAARAREGAPQPAAAEHAPRGFGASEPAASHLAGEAIEIDGGSLAPARAEAVEPRHLDAESQPESRFDPAAVVAAAASETPRAPFVCGFQADADSGFEAPRRLRDPASRPRRAPARPAAGAVSDAQEHRDPDPSAASAPPRRANFLVRKMTGVVGEAPNPADRGVSDDEIRRSIPAFLRRQAT